MMQPTPLWITVDTLAEVPNAVSDVVKRVVGLRSGGDAQKTLEELVKRLVIRVAGQGGSKELDTAWTRKARHVHKDKNNDGIAAGVEARHAWVKRAVVFDLPDASATAGKLTMFHLVQAAGGQLLSDEQVVAFWNTTLRVSKSVRIIDRYFLSSSESEDIHNQILARFASLRGNFGGTRIEVVCGGVIAQGARWRVVDNPSEGDTRTRAMNLMNQMGVPDNQVHFHIVQGDPMYLIHDRMAEFHVDMALGQTSGSRGTAPMANHAFTLGQGPASIIKGRCVVLHAVSSESFKQAWENATRNYTGANGNVQFARPTWAPTPNGLAVAAHLPLGQPES
jgi:hypothetical protein